MILQQGQIVWATMPDPQGRNAKTRPALVYTPTAEITSDGFLDLVAITSQVGSFPPDVSVPLPWQRGGHRRTTLYQPSEAICTWVARVPVAEVRNTSGRVPLAEMTHILTILFAASETPTDSETPP